MLDQTGVEVRCMGTVRQSKIEKGKAEKKMNRRGGSKPEQGTSDWADFHKSSFVWATCAVVDRHDPHSRPVILPPCPHTIRNLLYSQLMPRLQPTLLICMQA